MAVTIHENPPPSHKLRHYTININGTHIVSTTLTSHPGAARDWIHCTLHQRRRFRNRLVIGLGVQWAPPSLYYNSLGHAAPIQLCIGHRCLIFHLHHSSSSPRILRRVLFDPRNTFVGLWSNLDALKLLECEHRLEMVTGMPVDLRHLVADKNGRSLLGASIAEIADEMLDVTIDWDLETGKSDWEAKELSDDQVRQASVDAFVAFAIGLKVQAWNLNTFL